MFQTMLIVQPWVLSIREQVRVEYVWRRSSRTYTFDAVVTEVGGRRAAYAVKANERDVAKDDTEARLKAIAEQLGDKVADDFRIVTREGLDPVEVFNANVIVGCARDHDREAEADVLAVLRTLGPAVTLLQVRDEAGLGDRGTRAAVALISKGALRVPVGERLRLDLALSNLVRGEAGSANHAG